MTNRLLSRTATALAAAALLAVGAPQGASADSAPPPKASRKAALPFEKYTLPNGLEVILHEDHATPVVAVNVWYHVGSKDEPAGKNGFAHLFEHLMFQGSRNIGEDMFFKYLERAGASERNGTTNTDRTNYFETVPSNQLALALWLESDRMGTLLEHAGEETFASQRDVVKNERRQSYENAPYGFVRQFISEAVYPPEHPYHFLTIGTPQDLDAASLDDVRAFFRTFYVPNNATLVLAGDLDKAQAKALVEKYFAAVPRGAAPPRRPVPQVAIDREARLDVEADVELARVTVVWPSPAEFAPGDGELDLVANVLASGKTSRLYKRLVYDLQTAQDVSASQMSSGLGSLFQIEVTLKKGKSPEDALKVVDEELVRLRAAAPTADELERARAKFVSSLVFRNEDMTGRANTLNGYNQQTGDPGYFEKDVARYERATADEVRKAAEMWLPAGKRLVAVVTPTPGAPRAGRLVRSR